MIEKEARLNAKKLSTLQEQFVMQFLHDHSKPGLRPTVGDLDNRNEMPKALVTADVLEPRCLPYRIDSRQPA